MLVRRLEQRPAVITSALDSRKPARHKKSLAAGTLMGEALAVGVESLGDCGVTKGSGGIVSERGVDLVTIVLVVEGLEPLLVAWELGMLAMQWSRVGSRKNRGRICSKN
jgi:hypothetical protein